MTDAILPSKGHPRERCRNLLQTGVSLAAPAKQPPAIYQDYSGAKSGGAPALVKCTPAAVPPQKKSSNTVLTASSTSKELQVESVNLTGETDGSTITVKPTAFSVNARKPLTTNSRTPMLQDFSRNLNSRVSRNYNHIKLKKKPLQWLCKVS